MAEFKLGRIRFVWKGAWTTATQYYIDDVVRYGGRTYICTVGHTAAADFNTDLEYNPTRWNQMSDGTEYKGDWAVSTFYKLNDIVKYGGLVYICTDSHTSNSSLKSAAGTSPENATGLEADQSKWNLFSEGFDWKGDWAVNTRYKVNDIVKYGGYLYVCITAHSSSATTASGLEALQANWQTLNAGFDYKGAWSGSSTRYKVNDVVKQGAGLYICTVSHTSTASWSTDYSSYWSIFVKGFEFENSWSSGSDYQIGDVVRYGGNQYVAKTAHSNSNPVTGTTNWDLFSEGFDWLSTWNNTTSYKLGEVVKHGGNNYLTIAESPSLTFSVTQSDTGTGRFTTTDTTGMVTGMSIRFTGTTFGNVFTGARYFVKQVVNSTNFTISIVKDGTVFTPTTASGTMGAQVSAEPPNTSYFAEINGGFNWRGEWSDDTEYNVGDAVRYGSNSYVCVTNHRSEADDGSTIGAAGGGSANSRPDQDSTGSYWNLLTAGSDVAVLTTRGDIVYYGGAGPTRLPIGTEGQVLVSNGTDPEWRSLGYVDHIYYVAPSGQDEPWPARGGTLDKPFKTIRYACEQVEKGPRNPNAQYLLELNRVFIQREISAWIRHQITNNFSPFTTTFDYDEYKCERDVGFIIDRLIYDIGHGGNLKMRSAAFSFLGEFGAEGEFSATEENDPYVTLAGEAAEGVAAYTYLLEVVEAVLNNEAPAVVYQNVGDDSTARATQFIDTDYTAEAGVMTDITDLVNIVITALTDQSTDNLPERLFPNNLIYIKSGRYRETLPIIVPAETCLLGDEVRSTNAGPAESLISPDDALYSVGALTRLATVSAQVTLGSNVTETPGNTATQDIAWPYADTAASEAVSRLIRMMGHRIDFLTGQTNLVSYTLPTGYNSSYLSGYGDARTLLINNKEFIKQEITAFIDTTYPLVLYSRTICKRDVGYIVDAMIYDLTYGGYTQMLNAGLAYFDGPGSTLLIDSSESAATIGAYNRLKTVMQQIIANTTVTATTGNTAVQWTDSVNRPNGSNANAFVGSAVDIIVNILTAGSTTGRPNITVTSITSSTTFNTSSSHGLAAGDLVVPRTTANGVTANTRYYVLSSGLTGTAFQLSTSYAGSAISPTNGTSLSIVFDTEDRPPATNGVTTTTALITAYTTLSAAVNTIVTNMTAYITANFASITYDSAKCERDARIILDAVGYDFMFNSNFQTLKAAYAYLRASANDVFDDGTKAATRAAFTYVKTQAKSNVGGDATAQARIETLMTALDDVIFGARDEGDVCQTPYRTYDYARLQLERNRAYLVAEISAYVQNTYSTSVSAATASTDIFTCSDTSWMQRNAAVRFTGTVFGGVSTGTTYYIQNVVSSTQFKIATTRNTNTSFNCAADASGTMTVQLYYDSELCLRDVNSYLDAVKWDITYTSNYKSRMAARYYANAVKGSLEEDMYYLRNGTGVRNQTLEGLSGDLTAVNAYGTSRVTAGAYCSLDPGWGPADFRTWIISRSPYVQNVATFGTAAIGQKIDGSLHNGGNDSIVSNDFTQLISDGIGAWVTNNGRAELVSVFTYYSHIGYLAEAGGRIRGTNGNNSYGKFGSVAEGFDVTETPGTGVVDNRNFKAAVGSVNTDGSNDVFNLEFDNAGSEYTEATWLITGAGSGVVAEADEFRDDAVFEVRLLDNVDDSTDAPEADGNFGGFGYISNSNIAQGGTTTQITIAATDGELSTAYIGMKIFITGGTAAGQFGIIDTYNSGTKVATVVRESTGASGWDHVIAGTTIVAPDASSTYTIEPRITFTSPGFTATQVAMPTSGTWTDSIYGDTASVYTTLTGTTSGSGTGATWQVVRNGSKYSLSQTSAGTGYARLDTITIAGTSLGGLSTANDLVITVTAVNSTTGAINAWDFVGYGLGGRFVAIRSGTQTGATSEDGISWTTRAALMPSSATWNALGHGLFDDGSSVGKISRFVAAASGSSTAAYSDDGITWTSTTIGTSAAWTSITFGEAKFVAVASDSTTVRISNDGETWDVTSTLPSTGYTSVAYGMGLFVAVRTGTTNAVSSTNGLTWTARTLPAGSAWNSVVWGNGKFVAVATNSNSGAVSVDGVNWSSITIGSADGSSISGWQKVKYGQGLFMATAYISGAGDYAYVATSEDGVNWTIRGVPHTANTMAGFSAVAFGNPQRTGRWAVIMKDSGTQALSIRTGATAKARAFVATEKIFAIRLSEPGSGYDSTPTITITDPNNIYEAPTQIRTGKGALGNPSFKDRGTGYVSADAEVDTGDGYGDYFQTGQYIAVKRLTKFPVAGSNVVFAHLPDQTFKLVNVLTQLGTFPGAYSAFFQIAPEMKAFSPAAHLQGVTTRIRYSQVRLTGHDFLDIGTGNFDDTNYPEGIPVNSPNQANETLNSNGGRVFYTSTDQDGNFRVGELFTIEQSTGVATLNADAFNIAGLQELTLGEVSLGGGSASITEFSTDVFFTANSDSIVPTQRAIKAYISSQIGGGGASLNVNSVTAGAIYIAGQTITTTTNTAIAMKATFDFRAGVTGVPLAMEYFLI